MGATVGALLAGHEREQDSSDGARAEDAEPRGERSEPQGVEAKLDESDEEEQFDEPEDLADGERNDEPAGATSSVVGGRSSSAATPSPVPVRPGELRRVAERARELLQELRGFDSESISGLRRTADGWAVTLEVVELRRIPDSTDVLASYEVELGDSGEFLRYERVRRYHRSQADTRTDA